MDFTISSSCSQKKCCPQCREWSPGCNEGCCLCPAPAVRGCVGPTTDCRAEDRNNHGLCEDQGEEAAMIHGWRKMLSYRWIFFKTCFRCVQLCGCGQYIHRKWMLLTRQCTCTLSSLCLDSSSQQPYSMNTWRKTFSKHKSKHKLKAYKMFCQHLCHFDNEKIDIHVIS